MKKWKKRKKVVLSIKGFTKRILLLGAVLTMTSCAKEKVDWFDKSFFNGENNIDSAGFFTQKEETYYIYYYSLFCNLCTQMKGDISTFIENSEYKVYTLGAQNLSEEEFTKFKKVKENFTKDDIAEMNKEMIGVSDIKEVYLIGTPMLFKISEAKINEVYSGAAAIHSYIEKYL